MPKRWCGVKGGQSGVEHSSGRTDPRLPVMRAVWQDGPTQSCFQEARLSPAWWSSCRPQTRKVPSPIFNICALASIRWDITCYSTNPNWACLAGRRSPAVQSSKSMQVLGNCHRNRMAGLRHLLRCRTADAATALVRLTGRRCRYAGHAPRCAFTSTDQPDPASQHVFKGVWIPPAMSAWYMVNSNLHSSNQRSHATEAR